MARGRVWVSPGMLAAKVMMAPNSPRHAAKPMMAAATTPGAASGRATLKKRSRPRAPSERAATSSPGSAASNARRRARTIKGKAMTPAARPPPSR